MRKHRLLTRPRDELGSTIVESVAAMLLLLVLVLGVIQIAYLLYARNVVRASAHEGARAALEIGRTPLEASSIAESSVRRAVGGLMRNIEVSTEKLTTADESSVSVAVRAELRRFGLLPVPAVMDAIAHVSRAEL